MKKTLLLIPLVVGLSCSAWAGTCVTGTLATYDVLGFSCMLGDLTFSDFDYIPAASGGAVSPDAGGVTVTPVSGGPETGFELTAAWLAGPNQTIDSSISFDVSTTNPAGITDAQLSVVGASAGTGTASVAELSTSTTPNLNLFAYYALGTISVPTDSATFAPIGSLSVFKDIGVSGGTAGVGHLSDVYELFSEGTSSTVPEPSLTILCAGLVGLVPLVRRKFLR